MRLHSRRCSDFIAVVASTINLVSGYLITDRMLKMFKKGRGGAQVMELLLPALYLLAAAGFILALKWMSSPATARRGVIAGEIGMLLAVIGTLLRFEVVEYQWILDRILSWIRDRRAARVPDADDRGAAADRHLARVRRACLRPDRHGRVLPAYAQPDHDGCPDARDPAWISDVHGAA